jgi:sulfotransferase family protein
MTDSPLAPPVRVTDVRLLPDKDGLLVGTAVDLPRPGFTNELYTFKAVGWAIGKHAAVVSAELAYDGRILRRSALVPRPDVAEAYSGIAGSSNPGFRIAVGVLGMAPSAQLDLSVVFEDGSRLKVAEFDVVHRPVWRAYHARLQPLMVTSLGRMGTTWLMRLLANHPEVVVHQMLPYEVRIARYWMQSLKVLTEPANLPESSHPDRFPHEPHFIGHNPYFASHEDGDKGVIRWLGRDYVERLASFTVDAIDGFYAELATEQGLEVPKVFAEKAMPDHLAELTWELYPAGREVFLVRDPRDVLCSVLAFNRKRGSVGFGRQTVDDDLAYVDVLADEITRLVRAWRARRDRSMLVRYEDLIRDPQTIVAEIAKYSGLDHSPEVLASTISRASEQTPALSEHRTSGDAIASIGRWRNDLSGELLQHCTDAFAPILAELGYTERSNYQHSAPPTISVERG